jgi:hypothetical protein
MSQKAHALQFMATEDAINQAAVAKRRSDELIARIHNVGGDAASIQNAGPLRQYEVRQLASIKLYAYKICKDTSSGCLSTTWF